MSNLERVCLIAGAGHSGSTLLGMILGSHSRVFYAGEAAKARYIGNSKTAERKRVCKLCGEGCVVWGHFNEGVTDPTERIYERIAERSGKGIIVDSTKNLPWTLDRISDMNAANVPVVLVLLLRDGRAVVNSRLRKYPDRNAGEVIAKWKAQITGAQKLYDEFRGTRLKIRYEDLATDSDSVVRPIFDALGLQMEPGLTEFYRFDHHPLGGNNGTQYQVARAQSIELPSAVEMSENRRKYYEAHPAGIRLDMRWVDEMTEEARELFDEMAGETNRELAYEVIHESR